MRGLQWTRNSLDNVIVKEMWMQMATVHAIILKLRVVWIQRPAISMNLLRLTTLLASTALVNFLPQGIIIWLLSLPLVGTAGIKRYRLSAVLNHPGDKLLAVFGSEDSPLSIQAPSGVFNHIKWVLECFHIDVVHAFVFSSIWPMTVLEQLA